MSTTGKLQYFIHHFHFEKDKAWKLTQNNEVF